MLKQVKIAYAKSKENGGVSFNETETNPNKGYLVSFKDRERVLKSDEYTEQALADYVAKNESVLASISNTFVGVWFDDKEDVYFLDISENLLDKETALRLGILREQKAIYNAETNQSIFLPSPQKTGTMTQQRSYLNLIVRELLNNPNL